MQTPGDYNKLQHLGKSILTNLKIIHIDIRKILTIQNDPKHFGNKQARSIIAQSLTRQTGFDVFRISPIRNEVG